MATLASPLPVPVAPSSYMDAHRLSRQRLLRSTSLKARGHIRSPEHPTSKRSDTRQATNDSSDDEDLAPIKLSAEAQAILGEDNSKITADQENIAPFSEEGSGMPSNIRRNHRRSWKGDIHSPSVDSGSPAPRVMRVSGSRPSPPKTLARDGSFMYKIHEKGSAKAPLPESSTPAASMRRVRVSGSRNQTRSPPSVTKREAAEEDEAMSNEVGMQKVTSEQEENSDNPMPAHPSTIVRSRRGEEQGIHSTMRVRRLGTGTLLNGPIRRGMIRRYSEDEEQQGGNGSISRENTPEIEQSRRATEPELQDLPDQPLISFGSPKQQEIVPVTHNEQLFNEPKQQSHYPDEDVKNEHSPARNHVFSTSISRTNPTPANASHISSRSSKSSSSNRRPIFKIPSLPPLESAHDQENEPPPTFKRTKPSAAILEIHEDQKPPPPEAVSRSNNIQQVAAASESPSRQPLAARSSNTPHRPAPPPPPKMSLIDAATSAGASSRSKKSVHYVLNGRTYRRLDVIGRGGTSRVFRIMAENFKIFALKRVNLDEADMAAIAGFKGEIDLLKKLENVDRVVRLFDYEVNDEKGVLSVMMELGESDFNKMLNEQLKGENAKLDVTFTRHYWKEMLECVKAVHDYGIVHSDLKPANFLLVKGQLKLIDFGIAGAIQDNTVNVHRENQIGTPNYMSPESLVCHTPAAGQASGTKLLKLGRPSDVWSLGCILYQMTYGQPPFAHITKQFERIMSIPNPKVEIQFPGVGIGGAVVPFGLIKTLRRCLQRDQTLRPTIQELLSDSDPFLNPVAISPDMLGRVIGNVVGYCRKREEKLKEEGRLQIEDGVSVLPKDEEMRGWPGAFYEKLKEAGREGTAWFVSTSIILSTVARLSFVFLHFILYIYSVSLLALRQFQDKRWASDETKKDDPPISKLQPTPSEEVEHAIHEDNASQSIESSTEPSVNPLQASSEAAPVAAGSGPSTGDAAGIESQESSINTSRPAESGARRSNRNANANPFSASSSSEQRASRWTEADYDEARKTPKKTLYVGNLFFDVSEDDLHKEMSRFGKIQSVNLIRDARGLSKGFGYVTFSTIDEASTAVSNLNQQLFEGRRLVVSYATTEARPRLNTRFEKPMSPPSKTLFIGNMSWEMNNRDLNDLFRGIKGVIDVRVAIDRRTGKPRGFAHADFTDVKSAMEGKKQLEDQETYGRKLRIDYSYGSSQAPRNQVRDQGDL